MNPAIAIVILGLIAQVCGSCINCGFGPGRDTCNPSSAPMIVRPKVLPKVPMTVYTPGVLCIEVPQYQPVKLQPIGDLCSCNRAIVRPAYVKKTPCALCKPCGCSSGFHGPSLYTY